MPKEWSSPSDYLSSGLYANQNRKAIFRTLLTQETLSRNFNAMEYEEAADLSLKKEKPMGFESRDKCSYPVSYGIDETIDLSTKWRAPPTSERKPGSSSRSTFASPALPPESGEALAREKVNENRGWNRSLGHHIRMQPRKRLRLSDYTSTVAATSAPDIVVLSDDEHPRINGHINGYESDSKHEISDNEVLEMPPLPQEKEWDPEELAAKQRQLKETRDELRSEEMKLVLLKKLHQSQVIKDNLFNPTAATATSVVNKMVPTTNRALPNTPQSLSRSGLLAPASSKLMNQQLPHQSLLSSPQVCNQGNHGGPPSLMGPRSVTGGHTGSLSTNLMSGMMRPGHSSLSRPAVTTPPNLSLGYPLQNLQSVQSSQHQINQTTLPPSCSSPQSSQTDRLDNQTPAQRQAAAKLALRKQLEKTLLQIPPPKPPPPEMHFIPNANNQEFICLLGLEKIVDCLIDDPNINRPPPEPFECVQCGTDFSPVWKWQDAGGSRHRKPAVICETCVTSNIKKALKAEHTNRLKTAFVKALQQEQEIEQRMSQAMPSPPPPISASPTHTPSSTPTPTIVSSSTPAVPTPPAPHSPVHNLLPKIVSSSSQAGIVNPASLLQHLPKLNAAHQSILQAQAQQLQQFAQSLPQPQPAHMLPFAPLLAAQAYSYQLLGKSPMTTAEMQRQYLLDMIPPRSLPQNSMNWKT